MDTEQKDRQLMAIGRLHFALYKCAAIELESTSINEVQISYVDEDGDDNRTAISVETDDIAQQEIHDALIRYKQRLQSKLNNYEIGLVITQTYANQI